MSDAYEDGLRLLSRRSLTRREVDERLRARGHEDEEIDAALGRLSAIGAIDDAAYARRFVETRAGAQGRGRSRALAELAARGVDDAIASEAWSLAIADGAIEEGAVLARAVRKKLGASPGRPSEGRLARVYNALMSEGFDRQQVEAALAPYGLKGTEE